jgi:hypothetical protein
MKKLILMFLFTSIFCSLNAQTEKQDTIKSDAKTKEFIDPIYGTLTPKQKEPILSKNPLTTPGDYVIKSARLKLTGIGLGLTTSILVAVGAFDLDERPFVVILSGLTSLGLYIGGEVCLIKAGKLMNEERVTLSPASEGIGLAINF